MEVMILGYIIVFFIGVFILRKVFSIGKISRNLEAQTKLLYLIARANRVDLETFDEIVKVAKIV